MDNKEIKDITNLMGNNNLDPRILKKNNYGKEKYSIKNFQKAKMKFYQVF